MVIKAEQEEDERQAKVEQVNRGIEEYAEQLRKEGKPPNKKNGSSSRTGSVAGLILGPAGPIAQWGGEGKWRAFEEYQPVQAPSGGNRATEGLVRAAPS